MNPQTEIPVPAGPNPLGPCQWCGEPATGELVYQKGRVGTIKGRAKPVMERKAPACDRHLRSVRVEG